MKTNETQDAASNLTGKQVKVLSLLVCGGTIESAAQAADVNPSTVHAWMKEAAFSAEYRTARRVVNQATATLQSACGAAVGTLKAIAEDGAAPASSRVSAAKAILEMSVKAVELDDLAERIEALESTLKEKP
jgi:transposase-like protein